MNKILLGVLSCYFLAFSYDKALENPEDINASALSFDMDVGYTSYIIDVTSSELNRAIDSTVLELRVGSSYSYGDWMWGVNGKVLLHELKSNLSLGDTTSRLNDTATIDRNEFSFFGSYKLNEEFRANLLYRYAKLQSNNNYNDVRDYDTTFNYNTNGLAFSLVYIPTLLRTETQLLWLSSGAVYSQATVEVSESINTRLNDVSINDKQSALGFQLGTGYNYLFSNNVILKVSADWYKFDFGKLDVDSQTMNGVLEQASLNEETYAVRFGVVYRFN